jgi:hypothetical protein
LASPELQINLLNTEHYSDGTERLTKLSDIRRSEPDPVLFHVPEGYTDPRKGPKTGESELRKDSGDNREGFQAGQNLEPLMRPSLVAAVICRPIYNIHPYNRWNGAPS